MFKPLSISKRGANAIVEGGSELTRGCDMRCQRSSSAVRRLPVSARAVHQFSCFTRGPATQTRSAVGIAGLLVTSNCSCETDQ